MTGKVSLGLALAGLLLLASPQTAAQESTSFKLNEHVLNSGGNPAGGAVPASASFLISLDSIGETVAITGLSSASWKVDAGFPSGYPPPGEVTGLRFIDVQTLVWDPEKSAGVYNLYRDLISSLAGLGYGTCVQLDLTSETTSDVDVTGLGDGYFYLPTVENTLGEEGIKGLDSLAAERLNLVPCP